MYAVIKRADPTKIKSGIYDVLEKVRNTCDVFQRNSAEPHRFKVSLPANECIFNRTISMYLMSLDSPSVLHIVYRDTKFCAACFLNDESASKVWQEFLNIWMTNYLGCPERVELDQGSQFHSIEFKSIMKSAGVSIQLSGV